MPESSDSEEHSNANSNRALTSSRRNNSDRLQDLLILLGHLDLTGSIESVVQLNGVHGGYSDMYHGLSSRSGREGGITYKKVAIKRLRVHIYTEQVFAKVCIFIATRI